MRRILGASTEQWMLERIIVAKPKFIARQIIRSLAK
jgi:hypothetical protein